jgi:hypothetical protein
MTTWQEISEELAKQVGGTLGVPNFACTPVGLFFLRRHPSASCSPAWLASVSPVDFMLFDSLVYLIEKNRLPPRRMKN